MTDPGPQPSGAESVFPPAPPEKAAVWEDFIDVFYAPADVFARREDGNPWIPLIVVTLLLSVLWIAGMRVLEPVFDAEWNRQMQRMMERDPRVTAEQLEAGRALVERVQMIGAVVIVPITLSLIAFTMWLVGKLFEARQTLRSAFVVAALAYMPRVVESLLAIGEGMIRDPAGLDGRNRLTWGIGRFLDPDVVQPAILGIAMRVDVFTIWVTVLLAIGLSVTGKINRRSAAIAGALLWLLGAVPAIIGGLTGRA